MARLPHGSAGVGRAARGRAAARKFSRPLILSPSRAEHARNVAPFCIAPDAALGWVRVRYGPQNKQFGGGGGGSGTSAT